MKNQFSRFTLAAFVAITLAAVPAACLAEDKPAANTNSEMQVIARRTPFHGQVSGVDTAAMTLSVGTLLLHVTSETQITRDGKPATLASINVGEAVRGSYKKDEAGKLSAANIRVAEKAPDMERKKKADAPQEPAAKN
jgi:hypothetical protein